jgi:2-dehydropantoate 2-reductase
MKILVVGAGATGGYFGGRLAEAGRDVTFLVRPRRAEQLATTGLQIRSDHGDVTLHPNLVTPGSITDTYDIVLLSVKAYGLDQAVDDLAPGVGPGSVIVPLLNGMRHLDVLTDRFGADVAFGGVCAVATTLDDQGRIVQLNPIQQIVYGDRNRPDSQRARALDPILEGAGFAARRSEVIELEMWEKWVMLASLGALCCLMRATVGQVAAALGGPRFAEDLIDEAVAVAAASGHPIRVAAYQRVRTMLTQAGSSSTSSMYRDLAQGHPVEGDHIVGDLVARGRTHGVATPLLGLAYTNLAVYQASLHS